MSLVTGSFASPIGLLAFALRDDVLVALDFEEGAAALPGRIARRFGAEPASDAAAAAPMIDRLTRYFAGDLKAFDDLAVDAEGTPFQQRVWAALRRIPAGETCTYADVARAIGAMDAVRAVGGANGKNPIALVVPCHRVVGKDGTLTGYGGGLWRKRWLLDHERASMTPQRELRFDGGSRG